MKPLILALAVAAMTASAGEIGGTWRLTGRVADVAIERTCAIQQLNNRIQGPCKNAAGETTLSGEVNGKSVTWKYESKYEGATVVLVFSGIIETDSEMKGTITASDAGGNNTTTGSFAAKRQ